MKALILNMKDYKVVREFDTITAAEAAQDDPEFQGFPKHLVERENWDLTAVDMVKFYNNIIPVGTVPVKRFSDRSAGMARLLRALNGELLPVVDETAIKEQDRKKRTGALHTTTTITQGKVMKPKSKKAKTPRAAKATKAAPSGLASIIKPTKAGQERHWQTGRNRSKLFAQIVKKGEMTIAALVKFGETELKLDVGGVRAALQKMVTDDCVKVTV